MRRHSLAHVVALCNASAPTVYTPPASRILHYWPRYLRVRWAHTLPHDDVRLERNQERWSVWNAGLTPAREQHDAGREQNASAPGGVEPAQSVERKSGKLRSSSQPKEKVKSTATRAGVRKIRPWTVLDRKPQVRWSGQAAEVLRERAMAEAIDEISAWKEDESLPTTMPNERGTLNLVPKATQLEWALELQRHPPRIQEDQFNKWRAVVADADCFTLTKAKYCHKIQDLESFQFLQGYEVLVSQTHPRSPASVSEFGCIADPRSKAWAAPFEATSPVNVDAMRQIWESLHPHVAGRILPHVLLRLLRERPAQACALARLAKLKSDKIKHHRHFLQPAFLQLAAHGERYTRLDFNHVLELFLLELPELEKGGLSQIANVMIRLALVRCSLDQSKRLYHEVEHRAGLCRSFTFLHFAYKFAIEDQTPHAMSALKAAVRGNEVPLNHTAVRSVCNVILTFLVLKPNGYQQCPGVLSEMLALGIDISMDRKMYNAILLHAVEANDLMNAMALFEAMPSKGILPDSHSWESLLRGLRSGKDPIMIRRYIYGATAWNRHHRNQNVANGIMRCWYSYFGRFHPTVAYHRLVEKYLLLFKADKFVQLGLLPHGVSTESRGPGEGELLEPNPAVLRMMVQARLFLGGHIGGRSALYEHLIEPTTDAVADLVRRLSKPRLWSTLILAMGREDRDRNKNIRRYISKFVQYAVTVKAKPPGMDPDHEFFMNVLHGTCHSLRLGEHASAVLKLMTAAGIPRSQYTWDVIIQALAQQQDAGRTADALHQMELEGFRVSPRTFSSLGAIRDRNLLRKSLNDAGDYVASIMSGESLLEPHGDDSARDAGQAGLQAALRSELIDAEPIEEAFAKPVSSSPKVWRPTTTLEHYSQRKLRRDGRPDSAAMARFKDFFGAKMLPVDKMAQVTKSKGTIDGQGLGYTLDYSSDVERQLQMQAVFDKAFAKRAERRRSTGLALVRRVSVRDARGQMQSRPESTLNRIRDEAGRHLRSPPETTSDRIRDEAGRPKRTDECPVDGNGSGSIGEVLPGEQVAWTPMHEAQNSASRALSGGDETEGQDPAVGRDFGSAGGEISVSRVEQVGWTALQEAPNSTPRVLSGGDDTKEKGRKGEIKGRRVAVGSRSRVTCQPKLAR